LKRKLRRLDDDRVRWLDSIGLSKEMRMYSQYGPSRMLASQHFHRFCRPEADAISVCSNVTEMLGQLLLGHAVGPKAFAKKGEQLQEVNDQDVVVCHACPASLLPFHITPYPNMTCTVGPLQARKQSEIVAFEPRDCPQSCLKQQPSATFSSQSDTVQQRYCSISEENRVIEGFPGLIQLNNSQYTSNENELSNGFLADSSNNITCKWSPGKNDECINLISKQMKPSVRRWLFFGDSTVFNLFNSSSLSKVLIHSPLEKIRDQQCYRSQLECNWMRGERCRLNDLFGFPYPEHWIPPNSSDLSLNFTGPQKFGASNPYCCDCSGCFSDFLKCDMIKNVSAVDVEDTCHGSRNDFIYGGYMRK